MDLDRTTEPEVMDTAEEALAYDAMDHAEVNRRFVDDLLAVWSPREGAELLDLGTGTARIPVDLCCRVPQIRIVAVDLSPAMLDLARVNIELDNLRERIRLDRLDAKVLEYEDGHFDAVLSNSLIHHIAEPSPVVREAWRLPRAGGLVFFRDLLRPASEADLEGLVERYAAHEPPLARAAFRASLHAALSLEEVRQLVETAGGSREAVHRTSDRHWTWCETVPGGDR